MHALSLQTRGDFSGYGHKQRLYCVFWNWISSKSHFKVFLIYVYLKNKNKKHEDVK